MSYLAIKFVSAFLLPPLSFLLLGLIGLLVWKRRPRLGRGLLTAMVGLMWFFSTPVIGNTLLMWLERPMLHAVSLPTQAQAIVVLGGGVYLDGPEYKGGTVGKETLERVRYAARLYHSTGLPILVTGGDVGNRGMSEAGLMKKTLEEDFKVPVRWAETASTDTIENVAYSKKMLDADGIKTILLVTHAWHMERSRRLFENAGFQVITAATGFHNVGHLTVIDFLPSADGLYCSRLFFHELIGMAWSAVHRSPTTDA